MLSVGRFEAIHRNETAMDLLERFALPPPVIYRGVPDALVEERAERTHALEADFKTNFCDADTADAK
jgi:hypothetical protein